MKFRLFYGESPAYLHMSLSFRFSRHLVAVFGPAFQVAPLRARRNDLGDLGEVSPSSQDGFLVEGYPPVN